MAPASHTFPSKNAVSFEIERIWESMRFIPGRGRADGGKDCFAGRIPIRFHFQGDGRKEREEEEGKEWVSFSSVLFPFKGAYRGSPSREKEGRGQFPPRFSLLPKKNMTTHLSPIQSPCKGERVSFPPHTQTRDANGMPISSGRLVKRAKARIGTYFQHNA